jgi:DNA-binding transcriptional ArsR family regulator
MSALPDLSIIAALIGDPARAMMLSILMDEIALPASELAYCAKITPQTASSHLAKLVKGGLLSVTSTGRHRYYRLSNKDVARALESLALISPAPRTHSLNESIIKHQVRHARTCYDHLAGKLGVGLTQAFIYKGFIESHEETFEVTTSGEKWFAKQLGINLSQLHRKRRAFATACLDWSERKPHIAGTLGAEIASQFFKLKWLVRIRGSRAVRVTESGQKQLHRELDLVWTS